MNYKRAFFNFLILFTSLIAQAINNIEVEDSLQSETAIFMDIDTIPPTECSLPLDTIPLKPSTGHWYDLDSIATWGKFPKLCIDVYRWGDRTFNTYNSNYVVGTGKKWNIKLKNNNWLDYYAFDLGDNDDQDIRMMSDLCSTVGVSLTYMAVSVGYDINVTKLFNGIQGVRKKWEFQFCCSLLALDAHFSQNTGATRITRMGAQTGKSIPFTGIDNKSAGVEAYYFFNNKKYSQAAAYNYSKLQLRSAGSFIAGFSFNYQDVKFNFRELDDNYFYQLQSEWQRNPIYYLKSTIYSLVLGYGYNAVMGKHWIYNITVSPTVGIRYGLNENANSHKTRLGLGNIAKMAFTYNSGRFFASIFTRWDISILSEKKDSFVNSFATFNVLGGFRF